MDERTRQIYRHVIRQMGFNERPHQMEMIDEIEKIIANRAALAEGNSAQTVVGLFESPTGTGKTYAYLIPIFAAFEKDLIDGVVISAGTNTIAEQIINKDLPDVMRALKINRDDVGIYQIKGRSNYVCSTLLEDNTVTAALIQKEKHITGRTEEEIEHHLGILRNQVLNIGFTHEVTDPFGHPAQICIIPTDKINASLSKRALTEASCTRENCLACPMKCSLSSVTGWYQKMLEIQTGPGHSTGTDKPPKFIIVSNHHSVFHSAALKTFIRGIWKGKSEGRHPRVAFVFDEAHVLPSVVNRENRELINFKQMISNCSTLVKNIGTISHALAETTEQGGVPVLHEMVFLLTKFELSEDEKKAVVTFLDQILDGHLLSPEKREATRHIAAERETTTVVNKIMRAMDAVDQLADAVNRGGTVQQVYPLAADIAGALVHKYVEIIKHIMTLNTLTALLGTVVKKAIEEQGPECLTFRSLPQADAAAVGDRFLTNDEYSAESSFIPELSTKTMKPILEHPLYLAITQRATPVPTEDIGIQAIWKQIDRSMRQEVVVVNTGELSRLLSVKETLENIAVSAPARKINGEGMDNPDLARFLAAYAAMVVRCMREVKANLPALKTEHIERVRQVIAKHLTSTVSVPLTKSLNAFEKSLRNAMIGLSRIEKRMINAVIGIVNPYPDARKKNGNDQKQLPANSIKKVNVFQASIGPDDDVAFTITSVFNPNMNRGLASRILTRTLAREGKKTQCIDVPIPVVATSAVLADNPNGRTLEEQFRTHSMLWGRVQAARIFPNTFDYRNRVLFCGVTDELMRQLGSMLDTKDTGNDALQLLTEHVADILSEAIARVPGGTLVLMTNQSAMWKLGRLCRERLAEQNIPVYIEFEKPRQKLLALMREGGNHPRVLFGSAAFWEGIDLPGSALRAVFITRFPFPNISDPVEVVRKSMYTELAKMGKSKGYFEEYALPTMMQMLRQGVGRLMRREDDYGVIGLLDYRFSDRTLDGQFKRRYMRALAGAIIPGARFTLIPSDELAGEIAGHFRKFEVGLTVDGERTVNTGGGVEMRVQNDRRTLFHDIDLNDVSVDMGPIVI